MRDLHTPDVIRTTLRFLESVLTEQYLQTDEKPLLRYREKEDVLDDLFEAEPPNAGMGLERALALFREKVSRDSVQTWHPAFFNQMSTGASLPAVLGNTLASMINGTLSTFEASPSATVIERVVARWMAGLLGMKPGSSGIFVSGSSIANFMALVVARNKNLNPELKRKGLQNVEEQGVVLCSEASHYSVKNAINLMGLGTDRLVMIKTNERNEMQVDSLREALDDCELRGLKPFAIVVTLGSTVTGGFDPLGEIIEVCRGRNIHVHVDAAFGGGMALTKRADTCFKGIDEADTVTWDAHKWLHAPLTCTVLLAPNPRIFRQSFNSDAEYLFHAPDEPVSMVEDLGQYTVFCGKRFHALAIWLMFQAYGETFFRDEAENRMEFLDELVAFLNRDEAFQLAYQPVSPVLCFRFESEGSNAMSQSDLNDLQGHIRETMRREGRALFNITNIRGKTYFRFILINPLTTMTEMVPLLNRMREIGLEKVSQLPESRAKAASI